MCDGLSIIVLSHLHILGLGVTSVFSVYLSRIKYQSTFLRNSFCSHSLGKDFNINRKTNLDGIQVKSTTYKRGSVLQYWKWLQIGPFYFYGLWILWLLRSVIDEGTAMTDKGLNRVMFNSICGWQSLGLTPRLLFPLLSQFKIKFLGYQCGIWVKLNPI